MGEATSTENFVRPSMTFRKPVFNSYIYIYNEIKVFLLFQTFIWHKLDNINLVLICLLHQSSEL